MKFYNFFIQVNPSLIFTNCLFVDCRVGIYSMPLGPGERSHIQADKQVVVEDSVFVGRSEDFDCISDKMSTSDDNVALSKQARPSLRIDGGVIAFLLPVFSSASNMAPRKGWENIMAYPNIGGLMRVKSKLWKSIQKHFYGIFIIILLLYQVFSILLYLPVCMSFLLRNIVM